MNTGFAEVIENRRLYGVTHEMWLRAPELAHGAYPGQFVMLRCTDDAGYGRPGHGDGGRADDPLLPRPMSYYRVRDARDGSREWAILYDVVGRGTSWLANRRPGDRIYCWGPLGRGYEVERGATNLLLVGGGIGVAPLVWLADDAVAAGKNVTLVIGARSAEHVFPASMLHPAVEVVVATDDGSAGRKGFATEPFAELLEWCDQAFACGPTPMFAAMGAIVRRTRTRRPVQVLLEERMGCGTGICYGCAVEVRKRGDRQVQLVCKDGPRFDVRDVF